VEARGPHGSRTPDPNSGLNGVFCCLVSASRSFPSRIGMMFYFPPVTDWRSLPVAAPCKNVLSFIGIVLPLQLSTLLGLSRVADRKLSVRVLYWIRLLPTVDVRSAGTYYTSSLKTIIRVLQSTVLWVLHEPDVPTNAAKLRFCLVVAVNQHKLFISDFRRHTTQTHANGAATLRKGFRFLIRTVNMGCVVCLDAPILLADCIFHLRFCVKNESLCFTITYSGVALKLCCVSINVLAFSQPEKALSFRLCTHET
jgi:hypothetical protein